MRVEQGRTYRAEITLNGFMENMATNAMIEQKFIVAGFTNVTVTGNGSKRHAVGTWPHPPREAALPKQVTSVAAV